MKFTFLEALNKCTLCTCRYTAVGIGVIIVLQLEILRTECTLIGSPTIYEVNAPQPKTGSYSDGLGIHGSMISRAEQGVTNIAYSPRQGLLGSSTAARAEHAVKNLPFSGFYGPMQSQNAIYAKMQQLSLNSHKGQRLAVPWAFGFPGNTYGYRVHPLYQQTPPMYMNGGPVTNNEGPAIPIANLNPYLARWTIKGRVTGKTEVRHFGEGKVFSFDLLDAQGDEIRATCFNSLVDQYYDKIVVGNVYLISRASVKPVLRKKANPLNHEHELILDASTSVESCSGDDGSIPLQRYNFRQISEIENLDCSSTVDFLGVVTSVSPSVTIARKNGPEAHKRTIQLKDMSGRSVPITLWGNFCDVEGQLLHSQWESGLNPILAVKGGRISHFNGPSVGTTSSSQLKINPDLPAAEKLRRWYAAEQEDDVYQTIVQINDEDFGTLSQPDLATVVATISFVCSGACCYPACDLMFNGEQCKKRVTADGDWWWCNRCLRRSKTCEYRYHIVCQIHDHTGSTYATVSQKAARDIIGRKAQEFYTIKDAVQNGQEFEKIMQGILGCEYLLKMSIKKVAENGIVVKRVIVEAERLDLSNSRRVLGAIDKLSKDNSSSSVGDIEI